VLFGGILVLLGCFVLFFLEVRVCLAQLPSTGCAALCVLLSEYGLGCSLVVQASESWDMKVQIL
jgi:hypothetical protein